MLQNSRPFIRRTYKVIGALIIVVLFFYAYNTYLVDHSLVNLKIALNTANQARSTTEFEKIKTLLKVPLMREVSNKAIDSSDLVVMEIAENVASTASDIMQVEDIKFFLETVIRSKGNKRGTFLSFFDNINSAIFGAQTQVPKDKLLAQVNKLLNEIKTAKDRTELQSLYYELGNVYMQIPDNDRCKEAFMNAISQDPESKLFLKARFNLAWVYKNSGAPLRAIEIFNEIQKEYEVNSQYQIADALYKKGDYQASRDKYEKLSNEYAQFNLSDIAVYEAGYISLYELNDREAAAKYFAQLETKFRKSRVFKHCLDKIRPVVSKIYREQGYEFLKQRRFSQAVEEFRKAVDVAPTDSTSLAGMGLGYYWLNKKDDALIKARKALQESQDDVIALTNYLYICVSTDKADEAIKVGEVVLSKFKIKVPEFYYNLGNAYIAINNIDEAVVLYSRAIKLNPDFVFTYNNLGYALWMSGRYGAAMNMFKMAVNIEKDYVNAHFNMGVSYFYTNQTSEAYIQFKKVLEIESNNKKAKEYIDRSIKSLGYQP